MTNVAKITSVVPTGNFESAEDACRWAEALREIAAECYPDAAIEVTVAERQTCGGYTRVEDTDGDLDESAAESLEYAAGQRAF